jgi:hypothetical protein
MEAGMMDQQQHPQDYAPEQQYPQDTQQQDPNGDAAREQYMLSAFRGGPPRGQDGLIDFQAAVHLLLQHGADLPTLRVVFRLFDARQQELDEQQMQQQQPQPKMGDFGALAGRPRPPAVGGFSARR